MLSPQQSPLLWTYGTKYQAEEHREQIIQMYPVNPSPRMLLRAEAPENSLYAPCITHSQPTPLTAKGTFTLPSHQGGGALG